MIYEYKLRSKQRVWQAIHFTIHYYIVYIHNDHAVISAFSFSVINNKPLPNATQRQFFYVGRCPVSCCGDVWTGTAMQKSQRTIGRLVSAATLCLNAVIFKSNHYDANFIE